MTASSAPDDGIRRLAETITDPSARARDRLQSWGAPAHVAKKLFPARNGMRQSELKRSPWGAARKEAYQTERAFQEQVEELAGYLGWFTWHINLPQRSKAGFPDILAIRERLVWIELKVLRKGGRGKVMPEQRAFHDMLRAAGQEVHVFWNDEDDWREIERVLARPS